MSERPLKNIWVTGLSSQIDELESAIITDLFEPLNRNYETSVKYEIIEPSEKLQRIMKFYKVSSYIDLINAQIAHIDRLQKLKSDNSDNFYEPPFRQG